MTDQKQPEPVGYAINPTFRLGLMALLDTLPRAQAQPFWEGLQNATPLVAQGGGPQAEPIRKVVPPKEPELKAVPTEPKAG